MMYYPIIEPFGKHDPAETNPRYDYPDQYPQYASSESYPRQQPIEPYPRYEIADPYARPENSEMYSRYENTESLPRYEVADLLLRRIYPEPYFRYEHPEHFHPLDRNYTEAQPDAHTNSGGLTYPRYPLATQSYPSHIPGPYPIYNDMAAVLDHPIRHESPPHERDVHPPTIHNPNTSYLWSEPSVADVSPPQHQEDIGPKIELHSHICTVCGRHIQRDMSRHMRTHMPEPRFYCPFPLGQCRHRSRRFNRPYDFKKHLLNRHFTFDDASIKKMHNLGDKLPHKGTCGCGARFTGQDWLENHICATDPRKMCVMVSGTPPSVSALPASVQ